MNIPVIQFLLFRLGLCYVAIGGFTSHSHPRSRRAFGSTTITLKSHEPAALTVHHTAIKTRNITTAIEFYSLLGFEPVTKFRAGPARAAWLEQTASSSSSSRIELIEVPSYQLNEPEGMKRRALDLFKKEELLGYNHLALDVSSEIKEMGLSSLSDWLEWLNTKSTKKFGKTMRMALEPRQQLIGTFVYELAFMYDADGAVVELLHKQKDLPQEIDSGWEPWVGKGFVG